MKYRLSIPYLKCLKCSEINVSDFKVFWILEYLHRPHWVEHPSFENLKSEIFLVLAAPQKGPSTEDKTGAGRTCPQDSGSCCLVQCQF